MVRRSGGLSIVIVVVVLSIAVGVSRAVGENGGPARQPLSRQQFAQQLLATRVSQFMTAPAQTALRMVASGNMQMRPSDEVVDASHVSLASGGTAPMPSFSHNVRVNDPNEDTNQTDQTTQSETSIAVSGSDVAVGFNDSQRGLLLYTAGVDLDGYAYSHNGGKSWTDGGALPNPPALTNFGDPWLTSTRDRTMYYSTLTFDAVHGALEVGVAKSTNGGANWSIPTIVSPTNILYLADKDAVTAGRDPAVAARDDLYDAWDDFSCDDADCYTGLAVSRSTDGGSSWTMSYADRFGIRAGGCLFQQYIGAQPLVDPATGALYLAAEKITIGDTSCSGDTTAHYSQSIFISTDGGKTFGPEHTVAQIKTATPGPFIKLGPGQYVRTAEFPTLAIGPDHALYDAWNDGSLGRSHIRIARSTDGGKTWGTEWVTGGSNDEIQPAMSADTAGIHILYYRRNDDDTLDVYDSDSMTGSTFSPRRVTSTSFPGVLTLPQFDPILGLGYMGDYIANVSDGSRENFAWGDNRDRVTNFLWPNGRNDPNVYFARE